MNQSFHDATQITFRNYIDPFFHKYKPCYGDGQLYLTNEDYDDLYRNMKHLSSLEAELHDSLDMYVDSACTPPLNYDSESENDYGFI